MLVAELEPRGAPQTLRGAMPQAQPQRFLVQGLQLKHMLELEVGCATGLEAGLAAETEAELGAGLAAETHV